jgi:hypothetical protein
MLVDVLVDVSVDVLADVLADVPVDVLVDVLSDVSVVVLSDVSVVVLDVVFDLGQKALFLRGRFPRTGTNPSEGGLEGGGEADIAMRM